ncbi:hypothetical protein KCU88_g4227, partial [Aureobasidium melanogenum]
MSSPDISQLTPAQQEALQTYTAVTDQDPISAIPLLQRCEWNVQIAIARFFDGEPATDPLSEARSALPPASSRQTANLQFESLLSSTHPTRPRANPEDIVERVDTSFNLTLDTAKKDLKFLLVVLLSPSHDENTTWVQETLLSSPIKSFLDSHKDELLLWGGNVQDAEAYQTTDAGSSAMTVIMRAAGPMPASELVAKLGTAMTAHQAQLAAARAQRAEQQASRNLRQEQDSAYERSLAQDRERVRQRREAEAAAARAEREAQERAEALAKRKANMEQWRQWRAQSLPKEPGPEVKDAIRVSIRMASGERIIRKFHSEADLDELYAFVDCYEILKAKEAGDLTGTEVEEPANYEHEYGFRLVSPMPRTVFDLEQGGSVGERIGRAANLLVEPIEEDDEGSDEE